MSRTIDDVATINEMPPCGVHVCECVKVEPGESKNTRTPQLRLHWLSDAGQFTDDVYITLKTVNRLAIIASRICAFPKAEPLPDNDMDCANFLATYIEQNIVGRSARVTIAEEKQQPPAPGEQPREPRRKVTFGGYAEVAATGITGSKGEPIAPPKRSDGKADDAGVESLPF